MRADTALIELGKLPEDTLLRVNALIPDTEVPDLDIVAARCYTIRQIAESGGNIDHMPTHVRSLLFGGPRKALVSWELHEYGSILHYHPDEPYYSKWDLAAIIQERRADQGKTILDVPEDRRWRPPETAESSACSRIAHGVWRVVVRHVTPELLEPSACTLVFVNDAKADRLGYKGETENLSRFMVGRVAVAVSCIRDTVDTAHKGHVKGLGAQGIGDLTALLEADSPHLTAA
jgi:hypothetical protein